MLPWPCNPLYHTPQGVLGEVLPPPEGAASAGCLLFVGGGGGGGEEAEAVQLVRWRLPLPEGIGQWVLLCRLAGAGAGRAGG